jgi:hypothetical protein
VVTLTVSALLGGTIVAYTRSKVASGERHSAAHLSSHGGKSGHGGVEVDFWAPEGRETEMQTPTPTDKVL